MTARIKAWQCIGCGKIEAPQTCVGVCEDRKVEIVYAFEHEEVLAQLAAARATTASLEGIVYQLAWTKPRRDKCAESYRALQQRARKILSSMGA